MKFLLILLTIPLFSITNPTKIKIPKDTVTVSNCFVNRNWKLEEIRFLQDNVPYYYSRTDAINSTIRMDDDFVIFYDQGNGVYHESNGDEYELNWKQDEKNNLIYQIKRFRFNKDLMVTWENIECTGETISYTEYYTHANGIHSLGHGIRSASELYVKNN
jgi:hypothetical protein